MRTMLVFVCLAGLAIGFCLAVSQPPPARGEDPALASARALCGKQETRERAAHPDEDPHERAGRTGACLFDALGK